MALHGHTVYSKLHQKGAEGVPLCTTGIASAFLRSGGLQKQLWKREHGGIERQTEMGYQLRKTNSMERPAHFPRATQPINGVLCQCSPILKLSNPLDFWHDDSKPQVKEDDRFLALA
jgi:hypothetical protein